MRTATRTSTSTAVVHGPIEWVINVTTDAHLWSAIAPMSTSGELYWDVAPTSSVVAYPYETAAVIA